MPSTVRLNKVQLNELIESVRANGGDTSELEGLLREVEAEERQTRPGPPRTRSRRLRMDIDEEEETTEEHLNNKVGYLFPEGIHGELLLWLYDIDRAYPTQKLKRMCLREGLSAGKEKKVLAAFLIKRNMNPEAEGGTEIHISREDTASMEAGEAKDYLIPKGARFPISYTEIRADIDNVGWVTYVYFPSVGVGHIEAVNVAPAYRSRGLARKLLQFAMDDLRDKGITTVSLSAWSEESEALFKKLGFSHETATGLMVRKL